MYVKSVADHLGGHFVGLQNCADGSDAARRTVASNAERGLRKHSRGCAPRNSGLMKLLSRCAGRTRAERAWGASRASRTWSRTVRSASGAQATVVGQNAVTP